jgi:hypothetical protein
VTRPTFPETPLYQQTVSPLREGRRLRDEAIAQVEAHSPHWRAFADQALRTVALRKRTLQADDVWEELERMAIPAPTEGRAMGPCMQKGVRDRLIVPEGYAQGRNPKHHADVARVYRSLVAR